MYCNDVCHEPIGATACSEPTDIIVSSGSGDPILDMQSKDALSRLVDQSQVMQSQLKNLAAEQASMRSALECQLQELLDKLSSAPLNPATKRCSAKDDNAGDTFNDQPQSVPETPLLAALPPVQSEVPEAEANVSTLRANKKLMGTGHLAKSSGKGVLLDISKLPSNWPVHKLIQHDSPDSWSCMRTRWWQRAHRFVHGATFDLIMGFLILANILTACIQLQWRGYQAAMVMGDRNDDNGWGDAKRVFENLEYFFTTIFAIEVVVRLTFLGMHFLYVTANMFDAIIVFVICLQIYIFQPVGLMKDAFFVAVLRLLRLVRVTRFLRVVRLTHSCAGLRILGRAMSGCIGSLFWSLILVSAFIFAGAVVLFQIVLVYVEDESNPPHLRQWSYEAFGSISLSMLALWECTFTGSWHRYSRTMILEMGPTYLLFWLPYILCVNFAMMRLVGALFLKETMTVAAIDAEKLSIARLKRHRAFADKIREIFISADESHDGKIDLNEFKQMLLNENIGTCFEQLELEVPEVAMLYELLASDDGAVDYNEFLEGAMKLKQNAQTIDVIQLIHGNQKLGMAVQAVYDGLCDLARASGVSLEEEDFGLECEESDARFLLAGASVHDFGGHEDDQANAEEMMTMDN